MKDSPNVSGKRRIFNTLRMHKQLSRADLAKLCGLTRPAVSSIVDELLKAGIVGEIGYADSSGGKPPMLLALAENSICAIGLDLGDDYLIRCTLCDIAGQVLDKATLKYENNPVNILDVCQVLVEDIRHRNLIPHLAGVGVAVSGIVDIERNEVVAASTLNLENCNFAAQLEKRIQLKTRLEKRPNAAALAESLFGAGRKYENLVYLTSGRGIGAGIVIDGMIYRGFSGGAGEIGGMHMNDGESLEQSARPGKLVEEYGRISGGSIDFSQFLSIYKSGDADAVKLVRENAEKMAFAAGLAANFFDPQAIIIGGQAMEFGDEYFEFLSQVFYRRNSARIILKKAFFGSFGVAVGGSQIILDKIV